MKWHRGWWLLLLVLLCFASGSSQAQETPFRLPEQVTPVYIPAEWGTLRSVLPLTGNPSYYPFVFEDAEEISGLSRYISTWLGAPGI